MIVNCSTVVTYLKHRDEHHVTILVETGSPGDSKLHRTVEHYLEHSDDHNVTTLVETGSPGDSTLHSTLP